MNYLLSKFETATLIHLIENRVKAAACEGLTPAERTHLILFNPCTRQFASWLIPNAESGAILPNEPTDIKRLKAAGFVTLCKIPEYKPEPKPEFRRGYKPGYKPLKGLKLRTTMGLQAEADAQAVLQALLSGVQPAGVASRPSATVR